MGESFTSQKNVNAISFIFIGIVLALLITNAEARLYKWIDANGNTRYGDQLPQGYTNKKHFLLDAEGRIIKTNEAGKSPQQIKKERILAKKEADKKAQAEKESKNKRKIQNQQDRILLLTFNSEEDIFYSRDQRLQVLDSKISLLNKNKLSSRKKLNALNDQAENQYTSKNKNIPGGFQQKIEQMGKKITTIKAHILKVEHKRAEVVGDFNKDLDRFRNLKERQRKNKQ